MDYTALPILIVLYRVIVLFADTKYGWLYKTAYLITNDNEIHNNEYY